MIPRAAVPPGRFSPDQIVVLIAIACELPKASDRPVSRMSLFAMSVPVTLQNLMNDKQGRLQFGRSGLTQSVSRRFRVGQNFLQRIPVNIVSGTSTASTDFSVQDVLTDLSPKTPCLYTPLPPLFPDQN